MARPRRRITESDEVAIRRAALEAEIDRDAERQSHAIRRALRPAHTSRREVTKLREVAPPRDSGESSR
jgi:hypothetical protein